MGKCVLSSYENEFSFKASVKNRLKIGVLKSSFYVGERREISGH